jgi:hypothetical protein
MTSLVREAPQPAVLQDADACVGVTHGALAKAAVARVAAGHQTVVAGRIAAESETRTKQPTA